MSKKLFGYSITDNNPVPVKGLDDSVVDLSDILRKPVTGAPNPTVPDDEEPEEIEETKEPEQTSAETEAKDEFNKADFERFKEKTTKVLGDYVKDPKKVTKVMIKFGGMLRMLLYPFIYKLIIFDSADERRDAEKVLKRIAEGKRTNTEVTLDPYDQELIEKWNDFKTQKNKIMFTESEVNLLAEILEDRVKELPIAQWIEKYDWLLVLLYIESKRFVPVIGIRMKNQMLKDFSTDD
jgi:hypothetical protein